MTNHDIARRLLDEARLLAEDLDRSWEREGPADAEDGDEPPETP